MTVVDDKIKVGTTFEEAVKDLKKLRTGTLIKQFTLMYNKTDLQLSIDWHNAVEVELNDRFAGFDGKYFADMRHMEEEYAKAKQT